MTSLLIATLAVLLVPLFIATWRTSLLGLSLQGALMGWMAYRHHHDLSIDSVLTFVNLIGVRAILAPLWLYRILRSQKVDRRNDVIAPNMFSWAMAFALVLLAFTFAGRVIPDEGDPQTLVAVSTAALLLGLLVLATQSGPFSQMIGALRIENAVALFELGDDAHPDSIGVRIGQVCVLVAAVAMFGWYLRTLKSDEHEVVAEGLSL